jgi:N6-L-threonylcarbamoyladenine synthase
MNILGIESSCDETAASVVRQDGTVLSDVVASQVHEHAPFGGVVPELAARSHVRAVVPVIERALQGLPRGLDDIELIAVTQGPGLVGALLVGVQTAKALAWSRQLPLIGVDHLQGHLFSVFLRRVAQHDSTQAVAPAASELNDDGRPEYPFGGLIVSGGHTALYAIGGPCDIELLGHTRDDAAGEAYDKVAKLLGLGYPGGPIIDKLAAQGNPRAIGFPVPLRQTSALEFSFSGLKTSVLYHVKKHGRPEREADLADLCASFQHAVVQGLLHKCEAACIQRGWKHFVLTGGVAANRELRARAHERLGKLGVTVHAADLQSCGDNAAMIAYVGGLLYNTQTRAGWDLPVYSRSELGRNNP